LLRCNKVLCPEFVSLFLSYTSVECGNSGGRDIFGDSEERRIGRHSNVSSLPLSVVKGEPTRKKTRVETTLRNRDSSRRHREVAAAPSGQTTIMLLRTIPPFFSISRRSKSARASTTLKLGLQKRYGETRTRHCPSSSRLTIKEEQISRMFFSFLLSCGLMSLALPL
jgi:hypothetical protein